MSVQAELSCASDEILKSEIRAAWMADKILKDTQSADIPVEQPINENMVKGQRPLGLNLERRTRDEAPSKG